MKKCPKCGKKYGDSYIACEKDEAPLVELGQKEAALILFKKKAFRVITVFVLFVFVIAAFMRLSMVIENMYFEQGRSSLAKAEEADDMPVFKKNLKSAISSLRRAFFFNKINIFGRSKTGKICYVLGNAYLLNGKNQSAEECFEHTNKVFSGEEVYTTDSELRLKMLQSIVFVNGIIGGDRAIVNDHMVKEGDLVRGIEVVKITDNHVVFSKDGMIFSSSMDKYNPVAKKLREKYIEDFQTIQQAENLGIGRVKFMKLKADAMRILKLYMMDMDQEKEMESLINKCEKEIGLIDKKINEAKEQGRIIEGMNSDDVISVVGEPLSRNELFEMGRDERWIYKDKVLYFQKENMMGNNKLVVSIEDIEEKER